LHFLISEGPPDIKFWYPVAVWISNIDQAESAHCQFLASLSEFGKIWQFWQFLAIVPNSANSWQLCQFLASTTPYKSIFRRPNPKFIFFSKIFKFWPFFWPSHFIWKNEKFLYAPMQLNFLGGVRSKGDPPPKSKSRDFFFQIWDLRFQLLYYSI